MTRTKRREEQSAPPAVTNLYRSLVEDDSRSFVKESRGWSLKALAAGHLKFRRNSGVRFGAQLVRG